MVLNTDRLSYEELQSRLLAIQNPKHQAFLCLTYAALGRVGEVTKHVKMPLFHIKKNKRGPGVKQIKNKHYDNPPVSKEQIRFDAVKQKIYIRLND